MIAATPGEDAAPVTRAEFECLCRVVDIIIGGPGGLAQMQNLLSWQGQQEFEAYAVMRRGGAL